MLFTATRGTAGEPAPVPQGEREYGKKSEKISTIQPTLDLFDEADELAAADEYNEKRINVKSHSRKPKINAMNHLPEDIETEVIEHDIEDKTCSKCGGQSATSDECHREKRTCSHPPKS